MHFFVTVISSSHPLFSIVTNNFIWRVSCQIHSVDSKRRSQAWEHGQALVLFSFSQMRIQINFDYSFYMDVVQYFFFCMGVS